MKPGKFYKVLLPTVIVSAVVLVLVAWLRPQEMARQQILLGTLVEVKVYGTEEKELDAAIDAAFAAFKKVQESFSRSGEGELGRLNQAEPETLIPASEELLHLLQESLNYQALTDGAFDVTMGELQDLWGFVEDWEGEGQVPTDSEIETFLAQPRGFRLLDGKAARTSEATHIDLGAIAKGYAVDKAIEAIKTFKVEAALVNAGGNLRSFGQVPEPFLFWVEPRPFDVALQHPRQPNRFLGSFKFKDENAVATSGDYQRFFTVDEINYHHILNPHTGRPSELLISATVLAPTAMAADALSTAVFVMGPDAGLDLVNNLPDVEAVLVTPEGRVLVSDGLRAGQFSF